MNLFILSNCPNESAELAVDRHVVKIILEACQVMCIPFHLQGIAAPYKISHKNHPVSIWVRQSSENFNWTIKYCEGLLSEYTKRYKKIHKSSKVLDWIKERKNMLIFPSTGFTPFAQAMPDDCKHSCAITAYRNYYLKYKQHLFAWKTQVPDFVMASGWQKLDNSIK